MKTLINQQKTGKCIIAKNEWKLLEGNAYYYGSIVKMLKYQAFYSLVFHNCW